MNSLSRRIIGILIAVIISVLLESCFDVWQHEPDYVILGFDVSAFTLDKDYKGTAAPSSIKVSEIFFQLDVGSRLMLTHHHPATMVAYADEGSPWSVQTVTGFKITCDSVLYTEERDFAANEDLTEYFVADREILNYRIQYSFVYRPIFNLTKPQNRTFTFAVTLDDGQTFEAKSDMYELLPN